MNALPADKIHKQEVSHSDMHSITWPHYSATIHQLIVILSGWTGNYFKYYSTFKKEGRNMTMYTYYMALCTMVACCSFYWSPIVIILYSASCLSVCLLCMCLSPSTSACLVKPDCQSFNHLNICDLCLTKFQKN